MYYLEVVVPCGQSSFLQEHLVFALSTDEIRHYRTIGADYIDTLAKEIAHDRGRSRSTANVEFDLTLLTSDELERFRRGFVAADRS